MCVNTGRSSCHPTVSAGALADSTVSARAPELRLVAQSFSLYLLSSRPAREA
jgi:hypothetical protein